MKNTLSDKCYLPLFSKVFGKSMFTQMSSFFDSCLSKQRCGFRKGYSTEQYLLALLEKEKQAVDSAQIFGVKAFDCFSRKLLVAKINSCEFSFPALKLVYDYLSNRNQLTKVNRTYSFCG